MVFRPDVDPVPVHGWMMDDADWRALHEAVDAHWLTEGPRTDAFERALETRFRRRHALFCNSGSSANLLALASLELPKGSEVICSAASFPTTINPIVQLGLVPVFVDCEPGTWNMDTGMLEAALTHRTAAVIICHTLGNPVHIREVALFAANYRLAVISDCCDAAGALYDGMGVERYGDLATLSFYPAHQITTGEGGAVMMDSPKLERAAQSFRDWGRACWCPPGCDNTCGKRFASEYDHKYTYDRIGWNLKATDLQAAVGLTQLAKLDGFVEKRRENWEYLRKGLDGAGLILPHAEGYSTPSWFGFAFGHPDRNGLARHLDAHKIGNRPLFAGNIIRQPAYRGIEYRAIGDLHNANYVHEHVLWVGCWPGLTQEMLDHTIEVIRGY